MTVKVPVHGLRLRRDFQARLSGVNADTVEDYRVAMAAGDKFPPIVVYKLSDDSLVLVDGWHRVRAAKEAAVECLDAEVIEGTEQEALDYALYKANRKNGQRLSRSDMRSILEHTVRDPRFAQASDRQVASHVGVNHVTVSRIRREFGLTPESTVGADGKLRTTKRKHHTTITFGTPESAPLPPGNSGYPVLTGKLTDSMTRSVRKVAEMVEWLTEEDRERLTVVRETLERILG